MDKYTYVPIEYRWENGEYVIYPERYRDHETAKDLANSKTILRKYQDSTGKYDPLFSNNVYKDDLFLLPRGKRERDNGQEG